MSARFSHLDQAVDYLLTYSPEKQAGETYTLERMKELMGRLGNPQNHIPAVHVAGTSGKTSTCYYIRALLQAHGVRTGLTASPHISSITERVQIDGVPLNDSAFLEYLERFLDLIEPWLDIRPTYFELLTAFAFWVFKQERVEWMVVEVGLGGLLDATNVISSKQKICVITPIGLDHTQVLGDTIAEIAQQKAGIITPGSTVFIPAQHPDADHVIHGAVAEQHASLRVVADLQIDSAEDAPAFQRRNFALARTVMEYIADLNDYAPVLADVSSLIAQSPPGRFEVYEAAGKQIVLDGAHNPQKLSAFLQALHARFDGPFAWVVGFISAPDTKIDECVAMIADEVDEYVATQFTVGQDIKGRQSISADDLASRLVDNGATVHVEHDAEAALRQALKMKQRTVVVTGSLYLVAALRPKLEELAT
jgi:dihydrofolate synthase/folylpolyglutamate synthase